MVATVATWVSLLLGGLLALSTVGGLAGTFIVRPGTAVRWRGIAALVAWIVGGTAIAFAASVIFLAARGLSGEAWATTALGVAWIAAGTGAAAFGIRKHVRYGRIGSHARREALRPILFVALPCLALGLTLLLAA